MTDRKPDFYRVVRAGIDNVREYAGYAGTWTPYLHEAASYPTKLEAERGLIPSERIVHVYVKVTRKPKLSETTKGTNMQATGIETIEVNGVKYIKEGSQVMPPKPGKRAVVVVDRGWIFAGDVTREGGRIKLSRAVHVLSWESVGFAGLIEDVKVAKAKIKPVADVDMPEGAEIFCVPVGDSWGL